MKYKLVFYVRNCETGEEHGEKSRDFADGGPINQIVFDYEEAVLAAMPADAAMRYRRDIFKAVGIQVEGFLAATLAPTEGEPAKTAA